MKKYTLLIVGLLRIGLAVYVYFEWDHLPSWLILVFCIIASLDGVNNILKSITIHLESQIKKLDKELVELQVKQLFKDLNK